MINRLVSDNLLDAWPAARFMQLFTIKDKFGYVSILQKLFVFY